MPHCVFLFPTPFPQIGTKSVSCVDPFETVPSSTLLPAVPKIPQDRPHLLLIEPCLPLQWPLDSLGEEQVSGYVLELVVRRCEPCSNWRAPWRLHQVVRVLLSHQRLRFKLQGTGLVTAKSRYSSRPDLIALSQQPTDVDGVFKGAGDRDDPKTAVARFIHQESTVAVG